MTPMELSVFAVLSRKGAGWLSRKEIGEITHDLKGFARSTQELENRGYITTKRVGRELHHRITPLGRRVLHTW